MEQQDQEGWYVAAFGECYPQLYAHRDDEGAARELAGLALLLGRPLGGARVLDLCCGTGRHAQVLAEAGKEAGAPVSILEFLRYQLGAE